ncbi:hypothetical protein RJT34_16411 [Clitoria ternatea]|uniref:Uncharacterized protein n=1 Tax=Clitoria ternatea TaxID=43366 RepID=A0AAN9J7C7_CLITE
MFDFSNFLIFLGLSNVPLFCDFCINVIFIPLCYGLVMVSSKLHLSLLKSPIPFSGHKIALRKEESYAWVSSLPVGHFFLEEDDMFLERVQAAMEEEERKALTVVETDTTKHVIATVEESRKAIQNQEKLSKGSNGDSEVKESEEKNSP